ncbi:hypothetical protein SAMN02745146_2965 [Hymenobacter daecheongensis DSM 21074]|uniref:N-terminal double-transmembrane domain-containing protein n=1 Tax=Hymenobacter daecheongensis DSM 21074 TaxID=1121955 RepID=A0A1M6ITC9_9BACT|nr:hypothetical protein [Hymenobacter daecheongensis]SHJ37730.1 hypothetical protein SAMN02745146_2965 [Hymenobacter daecheongensis DSM 21074]
MSHPPVFYLLLAACLLLTLGLSVAALRRADKRRRPARLVAGWLAVLALWLTAYPPLRPVKMAPTEVILLTESYQPDTLRRLLRQLGAGTRVWRYGPAASPSDTPAIQHLQALRERYPALRRLHVLGRGLPAATLPELGPVRLVPHSPPVFRGFAQAAWNQRPLLGQPVSVEGVFAWPRAQNATPGAPVWLSLHGPGQPTDSVRVAAGGGSFRLRYVPKAAGLAVYWLVARQRGRVVAAEPVPVEVSAPLPLRVLLLSAAPSFEFKFLKNQLGRQQHRVALRTGLSRGLTQTEFLNQPTHDLTRLTPALLARYDIVMADAATLQELTPPEARTLKAALQTDGLGLVLLAEAAALPRAMPARADFAIISHPIGSTDRPQPIAWPDVPPRTTATLPATIRLTPPARALATTAQGQPVVATRRVGLGSITVSVVPQTYPWVLQNAPDIYQSYWNLLLHAARPLPAQAQWQVLAAWPRPHEPLPLRLVSAGFPSVRPTVVGPRGAARLALAQDAALSEWKTGFYWPEAAGWHQAKLASLPPFWFYVYAAADWAGPENTVRQLAAQPWQRLAAPTPESAPAPRREPWPTAWFFGLFVLAAGFLWLEEKW